MKHLIRAALASVIIPVIIVAIVIFGKIATWNDVKSFGSLIEEEGPMFLWDAIKGSLLPYEQTSYDKQVVKGRGHSPWVTRSNLDSNIRMVNFALKENLWASYYTQSASLYQVWQGEIDFTGAVYNGRHGPQPVSTGSAFIQNPSKSDWRLELNGQAIPATVQYLGHLYTNNQQQAKIRYRLSAELESTTDAGNTKSYEVTLNEQPEIENQNGQLTFVRTFTIEKNEDKVKVSLNTHYNEDTFELKPTTSQLSLALNTPAIVLGEPVDRNEFKAAAEILMENSDCASCHHQDEKIIGPSYSAVAHHYESQDKAEATQALAQKIIKGGAGNWGEIAMTTHADFSLDEAKEIAKFILENKSDGYEAPNHDPRVSAERPVFTVGKRLKTVHPNFDLNNLRPEGFKPKVGALDLLGDNRLLVGTWDSDGAVFIVENFRGSKADIKVKRIAEGLQEPLGIKVVDGRIFLLQKQEITELIDLDGDEIIDEYRTLNNSWGGTTNFHEFAFGLAEKDGYLYANLGVCVFPGGKSCNNQIWDRGHVIKVAIDSGEKSNVAFGLRAPNGVGIGTDQEIFITDNQGDWLPSSKLLHVKEGAFYGSRAGKMKATENLSVQQPVVWMPQNEIGNSPTQPSVLNVGPYKNQMIYGDIYHGGIKRVFAEKVNGEYQGALFRFSDGFEAAVNRIVSHGDEFFIGEIGAPGDWQDVGKQWFGLERLQYNGGQAHEILEVRATPDGFQIVLSQALKEGIEVKASDFNILQWYYIATFEYGGPKKGEEIVKVSALSLSDDRRSIFIKTPGLKTQHVVYIQVDKRLVSQSDESLWVNEAWYTLNSIPEAATYQVYQAPAADEHSKPVHNQLSEAEKAEGWKLLFNGKNLDGWKVYGEAKGETGEWIVEDQALKQNRERSDLAFFMSADNLLYEQPFTNFELSVDWKISKDGNSGIFYGINLEEEGTYYHSAIEMQVLDNDGHLDGKIKEHRAGDLYDLKSGKPDMTKPVGQWNSVRVILNGNHIEHWMNGEKILEIEKDSNEWKQALADSKFSGDDDFGTHSPGYILFQDHTDIVWYRNIKIREL